MSKISQLNLISNSDISYDRICTFRHITLNDIKNIGLSKYDAYICTLHLDVETINKICHVEFDSSSIDIFDILVSDESLRNSVCEAFSFFIAGNVVFNQSYNTFAICKDGTNDVIGVINKDNFREVASGIFQLNFIPYDELLETGNTSKKAKNILDKLKKGRAKLAKAKGGDSNINIPNMISSIVAYGKNYTYENIWSLTVYQLYDLFFRLNAKTQFDIIGTRWSVWGKDEFDFSVWYKDPSKNK